MSAEKSEIYFRRQIEIDGLRGLSIMLVLLGHVTQRYCRFDQECGNISRLSQYFFDTIGASASGVYLLFSISGFLIASLYSRIQVLDKFFISEFYARRALRIVPPYFVVLCLTWVALTLTGWVPQRTNQFQTQPASLTESLLASVFFLHQIVYGTLPRLFPPGWTLEVEAHFYALSPLLCIGFNRLVRRRGLGTASAWTLSAGGAVSLISLASGIERLQHALPVFIPLFLLGIVAHAVWQNGWQPSSRWTPALGLPAFIAFAALQPWIAGIGMEIAVRMILIAIMFGALASRRGVFFWLCTHPWVALVGIVSYSAYLVHVQVIQATFLAAESYFGGLSSISAFAVVPFSILMTSLVTIVFYCTIEKPLRGYVVLLKGGATPLVKDALPRMTLERGTDLPAKDQP